MSEKSSEVSRPLSIRRIPTLKTVSSHSLNFSALHTASEDHLRRRNLRHQTQLKNASTRKATSAFFKYGARSISELYDQCTAEEWSELVYTCDVNLHKHLNIALELYIKESLCVQRRDRWRWLIKYADLIPHELHELNNIFRANKVCPKEFSNAIYNILRCVHPKKNTVRMIGRPDSCKSLIAQLIVSPFISSYVNNHNSENEFYLASFLNKAICICEELMITPATGEDFKSILGGAKIDISKKYTSKQTLIRTPIIVTSNHNNFGRGHLNPADERALLSRCYSFIFNTTYTPEFMITMPTIAYFIYNNCDDINKDTLI